MRSVLQQSGVVQGDAGPLDLSPPSPKAPWQNTRVREGGERQQGSREIERQRDYKAERERERQTDRQTDGEKEICRESER